MSNDKKVFSFDDILEDTKKLYFSEDFYCKSFGPEPIPFNDRLFKLECNKKYRLYLPIKDYEAFRVFSISLMAHQASRAIHPLTCGVDSNHELLVPRMTLSDHMHVYVCPTCGYVQEAVPPQFRPV